MLLIGPREKETGVCALCHARRYAEEGPWDDGDDPFEGAGACAILPERNS